MDQNNIISRLEEFGLDRLHAIKTLRSIEYKYTQYVMNESIEEEANIHPRVPDELYCLNSIIQAIELD